MSIKSKAQLRFMQDIKTGHIKKERLSPMVAREFLKEVPKRLPERVIKKGSK